MFQINQKTFLLGGFLVFSLASALLFTLHGRVLDPEQSGNWWAIRFVSPNTPQDLSFEIENYSPATAGRYTISLDDVVVLQESFTLENTLTRLSPMIASESSKRVHITVQLGDEEKSLSR